MKGDNSQTGAGQGDKYVDGFISAEVRGYKGYTQIRFSFREIGVHTLMIAIHTEN